MKSSIVGFSSVAGWQPALRQIVRFAVAAVAVFASAAQVAVAGRYVFEAEDVPGVAVREDARASGGKVATGLGRDRRLVFDCVTVPEDGVYALTLETFDDQVRAVNLQVNGGKPEEKKISPGYDRTCGRETWQAQLKSGANKVEILNRGGALPDIDRLIVEKLLSVKDAPGRAEVSLDLGWEFAWGKEKKGFRTVDLPHDAQFEQPWGEEDSSAARGYKPMGEMWYRKTFNLADLGLDIAGKRLFLELGGLLCVGDVFLNGKKVASTEYGYLPVWADLTDVVRPEGENLLEVWCSTGRKEGSRWYTGAGLYRNAKLVAKPQISIARHGIFVKSDVSGKVDVSVELDGFERKGLKEKLIVRALVKDPSGAVVAETEARAPWSKLAHQEVLLPTATVAEPKLWDVESPNLYVAEVVLEYEGVEIDREAVRFGMRKVELDAAYGMKLNGRKIFLNSMSNHHDLGPVGAAAYPRAIERQFRLMKEFGYNAIRCSHNPYSEEFYDLADEMGILVLDELIDKWSDGSYWFGRKPFTVVWPQMVTQWMKRDRNHPSIFAWSFGNELQMRDNLCGYPDVGDWGVTMYRVIKAFSRRWDETRPTTVAMFPARKGAVYRNDPGFNTDPEAPELALETDFAALNYQWPSYESYVRHAPGLNIFQSEAVVAEKQGPYLGMDREHSIGCSYWGAIEYWGESKGWPRKGWVFSFFSHTLEPYPLAYLIKSVMDDAPVARIAVQSGKDESISWNDVKVGRASETSAWEGKEGELKTVRVYTNQPEVELFLNGESLGRKRNDTPSPHTATPDNTVVFDGVPFRPGVLKAVAYGTGGSGVSPLVAEHSIKTASEAVGLRLEVENAGDFRADGKDLLYVRCRMVDADGVQVQSWNGKVSFSCEGAARFLCCDNGDMNTGELFTPETNAKNAMNGFILAVFRAGTVPGEATITAEPEGFRAETVTVPVR